MNWSCSKTEDSLLLTRLLQEFKGEASPSLLLQHAAEIDSLVRNSSLAETHEALLALLNHSDPWLAKAASSYAHGCPTTAVLFHTLLKRLKNASLAEVFQVEYQAAVGCCAHPDFAEGVRALLVDKDKNPKWNPANLNEVSEKLIADILAPRFMNLHPLRDLDQTDHQVPGQPILCR